MKASQWKEYFVFTKKERSGILIMLACILVVGVLPFVLTPAYQPPDPEILNAFKNDLARLEQNEPMDSSDTAQVRIDQKNQSASSLKLFQFDPNTIGREGWQQLGLPEKLISTIEKYKSKGGRFYKPEDLGKIYGLRKELYEKLLPYIIIEKNTAQKNHPEPQTPENNKVERKAEIPKVDINLADTGTLVKLPAIGSKLAARIVLFREKLGGFYSVQQIAEVYGISDSAFKVIEPHLVMGNTALAKININTAEYEVLKSHPYIKGQLAAAIIQYRKQHQSFKSIEALKQIHLLTDALYTKLAPYLEL